MSRSASRMLVAVVATATSQWIGIAPALADTPAPSRPTTDGRDAPAAETLFDEARRLMREGKYDEACPMLQASQRLDPGVGTQLNLGDCFQKMGQLASAWAVFREAASAALAAGQRGREQEARSRASALEPKLARWIVHVASPAGARPADLVVRRDDVAIDSELWGKALPIDPGRHTIEVRATGYVPWSSRLEISSKDEGTTRRIDVPPLVALAPSGVIALGTPASTVAHGSPEPAKGSASSVQRTMGFVVGGVGLVGLAAGGILAITATSDYASAKSRFDASGGVDDTARSDARSAGTLADGATVAAVAGGVLVVTGVILWLTAPKASPAAAVRASLEGRVPRVGFTFR